MVKGWWAIYSGDMITVLSRRVLSSLKTVPTGAEWRLCGLVSVVTLLGIGVLAYSWGLIRWQFDWDNWPLRWLSVMAVPAFTEELVFRGMLIPSKGESRYPALWLVGGTAIFVLWHVVEALTFLPGAKLFLDPGFLTCAGILGAACAWMRYRTGSIWPCVLLHGMLVFLWQTCFGAPGFAELR